MKRRTIALPDDLADLLDSEARRRQTSVSEVIRTLIVEGFASTAAKPREIPFAGLFHDPGMVAGEAIDEVLKLRLADVARYMRENFPEARDFPDREQPLDPQKRDPSLD